MRNPAALFSNTERFIMGKSRRRSPGTRSIQAGGSSRLALVSIGSRFAPTHCPPGGAGKYDQTDQSSNRNPDQLGSSHRTLQRGSSKQDGFWPKNKLSSLKRLLTGRMKNRKQVETAIVTEGRKAVKQINDPEH
ncbi:MAG: hypothetical protein WA510_22805 [Acidobacteriaceae bacterium]